MPDRHSESLISRKLLAAGLILSLVSAFGLLVLLVKGLRENELYETEVVIESIRDKDGKEIPFASEFLENRMKLVKSLPVMEDTIRFSRLQDLELAELYHGIELKTTEQGFIVGFRSNDAERSRVVVASAIEAFRAFETRLESLPFPKSRKKR